MKESYSCWRTSFSTSSIAAVVLTAISSIALPSTAALAPWQQPRSRRQALESAAGLVFAAGASFPTSTSAAVDFGTSVSPSSQLNEDSSSLLFQTYQVVGDASAALSPQLTTLENGSFLEKVSNKQGALWLGEHHNSLKDHNLQTQVLRGIHAQRHPDAPMAVGLEQVQVQFQPVLDDFAAGRISLADLRAAVEWDQRWMWPFDVYESVFRAAQELRIPLVALNVNSEDMALVERSGLPGLPRDRLRAYIADAAGFGAFAQRRQFRTYVDYVIQPSYELHEQLGLLRYTHAGERLEEAMSFRNFLSGRILWDEAMANSAYQWTRQNPGGLLVGLVGADHVKFRNGIPGRFSRMVVDTAECECVSVMLNPTLIDTRPSGSVQNTEAAMSSDNPDGITLQLRYLEEGELDFDKTGGVLPLADYLLIG